MIDELKILEVHSMLNNRYNIQHVKCTFQFCVVKATHVTGLGAVLLKPITK
jgi:hypothetical protein